MVSALALSIIEIGMSVGALNILLSDMEQSLAADDRPVQGWSWLWRHLGRFSLTSLLWLSVVLALLLLWLRDHWELKRLTEGPKVGMSSWSIQQVFSNIWYDRDLYELNSQRIQVVSRKGLIAMKQPAGRTQDLADIEALERGTNDE
jgi:hypothetical protein